MSQLTVEKLAQGFQSKPGSEMAGLDGRCQLLVRLSKALDEKKDLFGEDGRPGNMLGMISLELFSGDCYNAYGFQTIFSLIPQHKRQAC